MGEALHIASEWNKEDAIHVRKQLIQFNKLKVSVADKEFEVEDVSLILKDEDGKIFGGLTGYTHWQCLNVDIFWIDENVRGQGYGKKMLQMAEDLAREKKCRLIKLDTLSFQAPDFYQKQGYTIYGTLEDFPEGCTHYYLYKKVE
ncbi:GNAT family N-acetyltransferase [Brevibacillus daliensis]|uniref:GNAT family N-acetyltransferase n=1 Tax=Brevibacillus daliensis TaxID=2892995 RepID=UPI001E58E07F|nr:GNAT family N-acetyltransferase [Brevibacillus daliensis]